MHFFQNKVFSYVFVGWTWNVQNLIFFYLNIVFEHAKEKMYYIPTGLQGWIYFQFPDLVSFLIC